jgi:hypothetical protein
MFPFSSTDPSQTILLAASGRSGTTWLGNIIAANPNVRIFFEPFDSRRVREAACLPRHAYARPDSNYPEWESFVGKVLRGEIENNWINRQGKRWWATQRLIKDIRANLMLGWIERLFKPKIIWMTRHPCAVVNSRVKLKWGPHLDAYLAQPELVEDYLHPFLPVIQEAQTEVQKHAVDWCIENLVPLHQSRHHNWTFCTYEDLYRQPEVEANRILHSLGLRKTWFTGRAIRRITITARPESAVVSGHNPILQWKKELSEREAEDVLSIVSAFGIRLYNDEPSTDSILTQSSMQIPEILR